MPIHLTVLSGVLSSGTLTYVGGVGLNTCTLASLDYTEFRCCLVRIVEMSDSARSKARQEFINLVVQLLTRKLLVIG